MPCPEEGTPRRLLEPPDKVSTMSSHGPSRQPLAQLQRRSGENRQRLQILAREHVGAAALEQTAAVEEIIAAGREQIEITEALREVVALTLHEVRAASIEQIQSAAPKHTIMLQEVIQAGRAQLDVTAILGEAINQALEQVTRIPPSEISLNALRHIQVQVHEQIQALEGLIHVARRHVSSAEDIAQLEQVSRDLHSRRQRLEHAEAVDKLTAFERVSESAVASIMTVEHAEPAERIAALEQLIAMAQRQLDALHN
jgi:hypothetical protein